MDSNEISFNEKMFEIYKLAKKECNYNATRFLQMLNEYGGINTAKKLLASDDLQYGFVELWQCGCLHLTVEALVLEPEFKDLFTYIERKRARSRIIAHDPEFFKK
jgi:hypothetical protein